VEGSAEEEGAFDADRVGVLGRSGSWDLRMERGGTSEVLARLERTARVGDVGKSGYSEP
jgi:hypothetical protein